MYLHLDCIRSVAREPGNLVYHLIADGAEAERTQCGLKPGADWEITDVRALFGKGDFQLCPACAVASLRLRSVPVATHPLTSLENLFADYGREVIQARLDGATEGQPAFDALLGSVEGLFRRVEWLRAMGMEVEDRFRL